MAAASLAGLLVAVGCARPSPAGSTPRVFTLTGTVNATPAYPGPQRIDLSRPPERPVSGATVT
jgi:hypothetical protein